MKRLKGLVCVSGHVGGKKAVLCDEDVETRVWGFTKKNTRDLPSFVGGWKTPSPLKVQSCCLLVRHSSFCLRGAKRNNKSTLCCCVCCCRHQLVQRPLCCELGVSSHGRALIPMLSSSTQNNNNNKKKKLEHHTVKDFHLSDWFDLTEQRYGGPAAPTWRTANKYNDLASVKLWVIAKYLYRIAKKDFLITK